MRVEDLTQEELDALDQNTREELRLIFSASPKEIRHVIPDQFKYREATKPRPRQFKYGGKK